jgi:hypothetical protein
MKETTPEEEAEMKAQGWDLEDVKLGPVEQRYRQPSLINDLDEHAAVLANARAVSERVDAFNAGERVRFLCLLLQAALLVVAASVLGEVFVCGRKRNCACTEQADRCAQHWRARATLSFTLLCF